jgi:cytochrome c peroxidase
VLLLLFWGVSPAGELNPVPEGPAPSPDYNPLTPEKIELGRQLFFDRRLSGDGTMSCATCHIPDMAFTDGQDISLSYPTTRNWRNTPTLLNVGYYIYLFHDGRASSLEEQALFPVMSAFEMNQNLDYAEEEIRTVPEYREAFRRVFDGDVDRDKIALALAAYQRTLVSRNAPLDRYLRGDEDALSGEARAGLSLFRGKARCSECHYGVSLADDRFHALNVPENPLLVDDPRTVATVRFVGKVSGYRDYRNLKEDPGRYLVTKDPRDWKAFRTPTLWEIARTAPYMHNGMMGTLEEVIEFFDGGGGGGNTALAPLGLTKSEKRQLKVFLVEALSGEEIVVEYPRVP